METPVLAFNAKLKNNLDIYYRCEYFLAMKVNFFLFIILLVVSSSAIARPKIFVKHQRNAENYAEIQVTNQTGKVLICYVAIDGHKIHFKLPPRQPSIWYRATDIRFNHKNFSTWCDYLSLHPQYNN